MSDSDGPDLSLKEIRAQTDLYLLVGTCISQFSIIEESLAALFGFAAEISSMETAFRINDEIREFQYRLGATDTSVRAWVRRLESENDQTTLLDQWNALHTVIKDDSRTRNRIAHSKVIPNENDDGTTTFFVCPYFQYYSHISEIRALKAQKEGKFKIPDKVRKYDFKSMRDKLNRFEKTSSRIDEFINLLIAHGAQPPK